MLHMTRDILLGGPARREVADSPENPSDVTQVQVKYSPDQPSAPTTCYDGNSTDLANDGPPHPTSADVIWELMADNPPDGA